MSLKLSHIFLILLTGLTLLRPSFAETPVFHLSISNHIFSPNRLEIPENSKVRLLIKNNDTVAEEFDSFDLNREKVIFPGRSAVIYIGPLSPGEYHYFGEFHSDTARGIIVVKEKNRAD